MAFFFRPEPTPRLHLICRIVRLPPSTDRLANSQAVGDHRVGGRDESHHISAHRIRRPKTTGHLSLRLLAALEAGQAAGDDQRGRQFAAMVIVKKGGGVYLKNDIVLRLQVDDNPEPIKELRRLVEKSAEWRKRVTTVR